MCFTSSHNSCSIKALPDHPKTIFRFGVQQFFVFFFVMSYQSFNLSEQTEENLDLCITKHRYHNCLMEQLWFFLFIPPTDCVLG